MFRANLGPMAEAMAIYSPFSSDSPIIYTFRSHFGSLFQDKFVPEDSRLRPLFFRNPERRMTDPLLSSICTSKEVHVGPLLLCSAPFLAKDFSLN